MDAFVVASTLRQLGNKPSTSEEAYYGTFDARRLRAYPMISIAILFAGAILTFGLPL
ncbi:MAG: hypothetical protein WD036_09270 [Bauldia sp.]